MAIVPIYHPGLDAHLECPEESLVVLRRTGWEFDENPPVAVDPDAGEPAAEPASDDAGEPEPPQPPAPSRASKSPKEG